MVKLVDMLFLGSSVRVFWFEFEWWYNIFKLFIF